MEKGQSHIQAIYGNRVRVRVCGFLISDGRVLMVRHSGLGAEGTFWAPPGGGVNFGETLADSIKREFAEETGLDVEAVRIVYINEFVEPPLHAIEIFFEVRQQGGILRKGIDPEHDTQEQIIEDVKFMSFEEISELPTDSVHKIFAKLNSVQDIEALGTIVDRS